MTFEKFHAITRGLDRRFPDGKDPFPRSRLLEECGELAQMVNHFEGKGVKREKYGEPDKAKLAREVMDLLRCAMQIAVHYGIERELEERINTSHEKMRSEGLIRG